MLTKMLTSDGVHMNDSRPVFSRSPRMVRQFWTCSEDSIGNVMSKPGRVQPRMITIEGSTH